MTKTNAQTAVKTRAAKANPLADAKAAAEMQKVIDGAKTPEAKKAAEQARKDGMPLAAIKALARGSKMVDSKDFGIAEAAKPKLSNGDKPKAQLARGIAAKDAQQSAKAVADQNRGQPKQTNKADAATQKPKAAKPDKASAKAEKLAKDDARKITFVAENPKRPGSASFDRFAKYKKGMTVAQAIAAGVTRADIDWDSKRDFIKFA